MKKKGLIFLLATFAAILTMTACGKMVGGGMKTEDLGPSSSVDTDSSGGDINGGETTKKELPALDAPQAVYFDETEISLTWNADENATKGWSVKIKQEGQVYVDETVTSPAVNLKSLSAGEYLAEIQAKEVEDTFRASLVTTYSFVLEYASNIGEISEKMPAPETFSYDRNADKLVWQDVENNNGYILEVYKGITRVMSYDGTQAGADTVSLPLGEYTAKLVVSGDGVSVNDSEEKTLTFSISSFGELERPQNMRLNNGMLVWDNVPHASGVDVIVCEYFTGETVDVNIVLENNRKLSIAELGLKSGNYKAKVAWESSRHDSEKSAYGEYGFCIEYAVNYTPEEIVKFKGNISEGGEHGGARLIEVNGKKYAEIYPVADGWGRVAGPEFSLDFDRNPIVFISVGYVFGGYHLQLKQSDSYYTVVDDTNKLGNLSADIVSATKHMVSGKHNVHLRLGVNDSTSIDANDAVVHYSGIQIFYLGDIVKPDAVKLEDVNDLNLNEKGELTWKAPTNGACDAYGITVKEYGTNTVVYEGDELFTSFSLYGLPDGVYTVKVCAKNTMWPTVIEESDGVSFDVKVSSAARYSAQDLDTSAGLFQTGAQGIEAKYDQENGYTVFNSTNKEEWGWISPKSGITVDMDKNPLVVIRTKGAQGGFFAKQEFYGSSIVDVQSDTSLNYTGDGVHVIRANAEAAKQQNGGVTWSGVKTAYKFHFGSLGKADGEYHLVCRIYLTGIDIVYVQPYEEVEIPDEPVMLAAPTGFEKSGSVITAKAVEGNLEYTPVYDITVTGNGVNYAANGVLSPSVDLNDFALVYGEKYTITVQAKGDGIYFADSPVSSTQVSYSVKTKITDFTDVEVSRREGSGSIISKTADGLVYGANSGDWVLFAIRIQMEAVSAEDILVIDFGDITENTRLAGRYYSGSDGAGNTYDLGGDSPISSNVTRTYSMEKATLSNGSFYLGLGMGGDSGERQICVKSIRVVSLELLGE